MKRVTQLSAVSAAIAVAMLASAPAQAITVVEANAGPQFNFVNPGARSLGMGGAFIGLADDSTAAYTNPAGLAQLTRKEFSAEVRYSAFTTESVRRGRFMDAPTGYGLDTVAGLDTQETDEEITNLSFISFALPFERATLAFYRHELVNFSSAFVNEGQFVQTLGQTPPSQPRTSRFPPTINELDVQIDNYGFAGSWRANDKLLLGASLNFYRFDIDSVTRRFEVDANDDGTVTPEERLSVLDFSPDAEFGRLFQNGSDTDVGFNLGLLWMPNEKFSLGAVYRRGPDFEYDFTSFNNGVLAFEGETDFTVPDVWGLGFAYRPSDAWRVSLDIAHVTYSDHAENVVEQSFVGDVDYLVLDDTTEIRLGAEYTDIEAAHPWSLRFGVWQEPAHRLHFDGTITPFAGVPLTQDQAAQNARAAMFLEGEDYMHFTAGYGIVFEKLQFDVAIDLSEPTDILSLSMVYFFD